MSVSPRSAYVHTLDDDVLLHIFTMNGNMFLDRNALPTTYATSQVCQRWRNLMLDTPTLWARLIDIDRLSYIYDCEWWIKLITRSGTAPLWIRVDWVHKMKPVDGAGTIEQFLFAVLHENWHRIQKLSASFQVGGTFHPTSWKIFCSPAPELEMFDVAFETTENAENYDNTPISTLFSGTAPMLRKFSLLDYTVDEHVPWLCQLHSMLFDDAYSVHRALAVLSSTHHLQQLKIRDTHYEAISTPFPIASLPDLNYLKYSGPPQEGAILLDHIEIPLNCSLDILNPYHGIPDAATEGQRLSIVTTFVRYAQRYLRSHVSNVIDLDHRRHGCFTVKVEAKLPADVSLTISIPFCKMGDSYVPLKILKKLALPEFSYVTELKYTLEVPLNPSFGPFFSCFTSLRIICTDSETLGHLMALQYAINFVNMQINLFPLLEVIKLTSRFTNNDIFKVDTVTAGFILMRIRDGHPVTALRLPDYCCTVAPDLEALAEAKGLKVLYMCWINGDLEGRDGRSEDLEYICGSVDLESII